ncbi:MAG: ATP-binding protein, partial [Gemmatimonas sp.]
TGRRIAFVGKDVPFDGALGVRSDRAGDRDMRGAAPTVVTVPRPGVRALPASNSLVYGELYADSSRVYYWTVAAVNDEGRVVGYLAQQNWLALPGDLEPSLRAFTGDNMTLVVRNKSDDLWALASGTPMPPQVRGEEVGAAHFYDGASGRVIAAELDVAGVPWVALIETPLHSVHARVRQVLVLIAGLGALLTVVGAIAAVVIGRRVASPLAELTNAAEAIAQGDYARRVPFSGPDEIGRLGTSFNQMAEQVDVTQQELQQRFEETMDSVALMERANERLQIAMKEAERSREEAQHANRAKSDFLAVMSHELRTPLNAIGGYAQLLDLGIHGPVTDKQHDALTRIARSQAHLLRLINDVLNFARVDAGQVRYSMRDVPVLEALTGVEPLVAPQMDAKHLTFWLGSIDPTLTVYADGDKLQQIVLNLLTNAIKFTPHGGRIWMECQAGEEFVRIRVCDTGVGIPTERLDMIFDPFVQLERTISGTRDGVGLGLAISRDLARGMAGDLEVESRVGGGSTFTLVLPSHVESPVRPVAAA